MAWKEAANFIAAPVVAAALGVYHKYIVSPTQNRVYRLIDDMGSLKQDMIEVKTDIKWIVRAMKNNGYKEEQK